MARGSQEREQEFIATASDATGHSILEWMTIIEAAGLPPKNQPILKHLKKEHGLNHMQANYLAGIYLNNGEAVYNYERMYASLFDGNVELQALYETLQAQIAARFSPEQDVVFVPTRNYISIEGAKIFACAKMTKKVIRLGLDLDTDTVPFDETIQKAKALGAMPNITHMIEVKAESDIDATLLDAVQQAYRNVHA